MVHKLKVRKIVLCLMVVVILGIIINFFGKNTFILNEMVNTLVDSANKEEGIEVLDKRSDYGKLVGNGNGIEYYGAILVKASSENDVVRLVENVKENYEIVGYHLQADRVVDEKFLRGVYYMVDEGIFEEFSGQLYSVYFFTTHEDSNLFDPKGH